MSDENNEDVQTDDTPPQDSEWDTPPPPDDPDVIERDLNFDFLREKLRNIIKKKD